MNILHLHTRRKDLDMIHGPLAKKMVLFALPLAVSGMLQQLFNAADLAVVGRFSNAQAMAAVGSNASVISLMVNLFLGLSVGANVVIANLLGQGRRDKISDAVHTVIAMALASGGFLLVAGIFVAHPLLHLMGAPEDVMNLAVLYLRIYFLGMPAIMLYNFGSAILRSKGDSTRPFISLTIAGVVNVILNLFFVIGFHLHVIGVALATVLSNCLSAGMVMYFLMHEEDEFRLYPARLKFVPEYMKSVIQIGFPAGLQGVVFSISNVVIQTAVNSFGADCIAGMTAGQNFDFISYCLLNAFTQTVVTFTSQNYGAAQPDRCKKVWKLGIGLGIGIDIVFVGLLMLAKGSLIRIFTTDPDVTYYAMIRLNYAFALHFLCGTYEITGGALRGMNRSMVPALICMIGTCGFRLLYVLVLFPFFRTPQMLLMVYPITWILTGIVMNTAYFIVRKKVFAKMNVDGVRPH